MVNYILVLHVGLHMNVVGKIKLNKRADVFSINH
jgi:hypothetical protein